MKPTPRILSRSIATLGLVALATALTAPKLQAASGNWTATGATGAWGTATNWSSNPTVPGSAAGDVIQINSNIGAAAAITLDANRTMGSLLLGDLDGTHAFTLNTGTAGSTLILDQTGTVGTAVALVRFGAPAAATLTAANTISSAITLNDNARFYTTLTGAQTLSGIIGGANRTVVFDNDDGTTLAASVAGQGAFALSGANTFSGGTTIDDVRVTISGSNLALGAAGSAVTIRDGGQVFNSTGLTTINYAFNIAGNGWEEATAGVRNGALRLDSGAIVTGSVTMSANAAIGSGSGTGTVNGIVSGAFTLSKVGVGTIVLGGANTYSEGTTLANGSLQLNNNAAAGTGAINLVTGGTTGTATRLLINGGVTITNPINIGAHTGLAGQGSLQSTGTGLSSINGPINITGSPSAGGHFVGGTSANNFLVLNGAITSTVGLSQRDGFVRYTSGGTGYTALNVTGVAQVGALNGLATSVTPLLGGSGTATLDLNGFDQTLAGVLFGVTSGTNTTTHSGNIALGANRLTLNGDITTQLASTTVTNVSHNITGSTGGILDFGATPRALNIVDNPMAFDELVINGATVEGVGVTKTGAGTLSLNNATFTAPLTVSAGTLATGRLTSPGSATLSGLNFGVGATTLRMKLGTGGDAITVTNPGGLTTAGTTTVNLNQLGGILANGTYPLINYTGASPGLGGFMLNPVGHSNSSLIDTGTAIALSVTGNDKVIWTGGSTNEWTTAATLNWNLATAGTPTNYIESDDVIFQDSPISNTVTVAANVSPSNVLFTNTTATPYTITGAGGIIGATALTKMGNGAVNLGTPNQYTGATTISAGNLIANYTTATPIAVGSAISVASGATVTFAHNGGAFGLANTISGAGTIVVDPSLTTAGNRDINPLTWNLAGFTGTLRLAPTLGTMRIQVDNAADIGSGPVEIANNGQIIVTAANLTLPNNFTISGNGYSETSGTLGAIRASNPTTFTGQINVVGSAKIGALAGTAIIANAIGGGPLTFGGSLTNTGSETLAITGDASGLTSITVNDGSATAGAASIAVNVGNNTASGTIGNVPVSLLADGFKNSVIRFDRTDGYTLGGAITSISSAANHVRTFVDADSQGTGFSDGGLAINLGSSTPGVGGSYRVSVNRANSIGNISGVLTAGTVLIGSGQASGTMNVNSGGVVNVGTVRIGLAGTTTTSTLNINSGGSFTAFSLGLGELAGVGGVVNQAAGSTVNVDSQLRVGHFGTNTSVYNMNGGTLTMTGASPLLTPSTAGAGGASATGDNNINATAAQVLVGGGIYLGIDGTGVFNHTGGTVSTNWIVLDNRTDTGAGTNMPDGVDRYNLSGAGSVLNLKSTWGLIQRNNTSSVSLGGGTVRVDNTGTGGPAGNTGANITVPLDATLDTVAGTTTTLDTNGAGNGFTLPRDVRGTGKLNLIGGGAINLSTTGVQTIAPALSSTGTAANLVKLGSGITTLAGSGAEFTGAVTVSAGRLNIPNNLAAPTITIGDGATLSGEATTTTLNAGVATGGALIFNPNTAGALTTTALNVTGTNTLDFAVVPLAGGPITAINYTTKSGAGSFAVANAASYRSAVVNDTGSAITVNVSGAKDLTWTGAGGAAWDVNTTTNWTDPALVPEKFFSADTVTFGDGPTVTGVTVTSGVSPWKTTVNSTTNNYTLTSTGNGIAGPGSLEKSGTSTLTLVGPNTYTGQTVVGGGGVLAFTAANSLGNANSATNGITIGGGGRLSYTGATAVDLGLNRSIGVDSGGGSISHNNATAVTITIPGNLAGSGANLSFHSNAAGAGNFVLSGDNSQFTGTISVDGPTAGGGGQTNLRFANQAAVPAVSSITINYPANITTSGEKTGIELTGVSLPETMTLNLTSRATGALSQRSQVLSTGSSFIEGPIFVTGSGVTGTTQTPVVQLQPNSGTLTVNGDISEGAGGFSGISTAFPAVFFARGAGNTIFNGTINLPNANFVRVDNTGITTINSTGNVWANTEVRASGTLRIGATNALPVGALMTIGQASDSESSIFDLNGFDQEVNGLTSIAGQTTNNNRRVTNSSATLSTLTLNGATNRTFGNSTGVTGGNLTGNLALVKNGSYTQTLAGPANTYTGNVTVNAGTLVAGGVPASTALGSVTVPGRTVTVNGPGALSFTTNNVFGDGRVAGSPTSLNPNLPETILNAGATLNSTRYNVLGPVTLNGATLAQSVTDTGTYEGFQFKGAVTVGGAAASTISTGNAKANHLDANTLFTVANATGDGAVDLLISAPLRNQSADFNSAAGGLTKAGPGTLSLTATSTYTGATNVNEGALLVSGNIAGSAVVVDGASAALQGNGTVGAVTVQNGGTLAPGSSFATLNTGNINLTSTGNLSLELGNSNGLNQPLATDYDRLNVSGSVTLAGNIQLTLGAGINYNEFGGDVFYVILNDDAGADAVSGTFATYEQGSTITIGANQFRISYTADSALGGSAGFASTTGNDVALLAIPEPSSFLSLLSGLGALVGLQRFRRRNS